MIARVLSIALAVLGCTGLWIGYMNLNIFRGTPLFEFRYIIFAVAAFLGLSCLEWAAGWVKSKLEDPNMDH